MLETIIKNFDIQECCRCGCLFALTRDMDKNLRETKNTFYCPNGHGQSYTKSTADILKGKLDAMTAERDMLHRRLQEKPKRGRKPKVSSPAK